MFENQMVKYLHLCLLLTFSSPALAKWTVAASSTDGVFYVYLAADGIHKTSETTVRHWQILDLAKAENGTESYLAMDEVDCLAKRARTFEFASFSRPMAQGKRTHTLRKTSDWRYLPPNTPGADVLKAVCSFALPRVK
jgi:hypothetical protein